MTRFDRAVRQFDAQRFVGRLGGQKESRSTHSHEWLMPCPKCGSGRLRWNQQKDAWICWGCHRTGSTLELVQLCLRVEEDKAFEYIMGGYEGGNAKSELDVAINVVAPPKRATLRRLPQVPWPQGVERLDRHEAHAGAWKYLFSRGVSYDMAAPWGLGYGRTGWLENYIVFPVHMDDGLVYWQGRACFDPEGGRKGFKKTLNPKSEGDNATASEALLNYDRVRLMDHVVITEGPFDALKVGTHAVALLGKASSPAKIARLLRLRANRFTVYLDRGDDERKHATRLAQELSVQATVYIAEPPEGYDAGALTPEQNDVVIARAERFGRALSARPLAGY